MFKRPLKDHLSLEKYSIRERKKELERMETMKCVFAVNIRIVISDFTQPYNHVHFACFCFVLAFV
jgi:hypothetical protein